MGVKMKNSTNIKELQKYSNLCQCLTDVGGFLPVCKLLLMIIDKPFQLQSQKRSKAQPLTNADVFSLTRWHNISEIHTQ